MKILICDDDKTSLFVLAKMLEKLGVQVLAAEDGAQGWDAFVQERPLVVITDVQMPQMDGLQLCRKIRESRESRNTYVILVSAFRDEEKFSEAMASGADDFISKPFEKAKLAARLHVAQRVLNLNKQVEHLGGTPVDPSSPVA